MLSLLVFVAFNLPAVQLMVGVYRQANPNALVAMRR
jgi:hypothetical protein